MKTHAESRMKSAPVDLSLSLSVHILFAIACCDNNTECVCSRFCFWWWIFTVNRDSHIIFTAVGTYVCHPRRKVSESSSENYKIREKSIFVRWLDFLKMFVAFFFIARISSNRPCIHSTKVFNRGNENTTDDLLTQTFYWIGRFHLSSIADCSYLFKRRTTQTHTRTHPLRWERPIPRIIRNTNDMFHIFRWRRERHHDNTASTDPSADQQHKKAHSKRHHLRIYRGRPSFERLFHVRRHRSASSTPTHQVTNALAAF